MKSNKFLIVVFGIALCALSACESKEQVPTSEVQIANPASVYCEQNGYNLEIRTADDGSQYGVCVSPDGSTCDEWAYFRGDCSMETQEAPKPEQTTESISDASGGYMAPGTSEEFADWWGVIKSTGSGAQYDDYFERQDTGGPINFGIDSLDPEVAAQIQSLRDSGKIVHLYGTLFSNVPDYNGSQVQVDRIEVDGD